MNLQEFTAEYLHLLKTEFKGLNLTRILDEDEFFLKQIYDSVYPFTEIPELKNLLENIGCLTDIGFGGGLPLLPLAFSFPNIDYQGVEARHKKLKAVHGIAQKLLSHVRINFLHERLENMIFDRECIITFKAVGKIKDLLKNINNKACVHLLFYKAKNFYEEEGDILNSNLKDIKVFPYLLHSKNNETVHSRYIIYIRKEPALPLSNVKKP